MDNPALHPGGGWVGDLCHEPRISQKVLELSLKPYIIEGSIIMG